MTKNSTPKRPAAVQEARNNLRRKGWTIQAAAIRFDVTRQHLSLVLNGHRKSRRLLDEIAGLPENPDPA